MDTMFGIDFGTTNTRVAFFDGERVRMVQFRTARGTHSEFPTLVAYSSGNPAAFGSDAKKEQDGATFPEPLKWILRSDLPVEIDGGTREPVGIVADFLRKMRELVEQSTRKRLEQAAVTIPVHYPPKAREGLKEAFWLAGIEVTHFFFEPIAAIYTSLVAQPVSGVTAVFDWGGGSLDIATVQIRDGVALTRQLDGWHRGGNDFDNLICLHAVNDFLAGNPQPGYTAELILERMKAGRDLRLTAELAKIQLSKASEAMLTYQGFMRDANLDYKLTRHEFDDLLTSDVNGGFARLERALRASGVTAKTLARLFLSGGTCNIPAIRERLTAEIGGRRIVGRLRLPDELRSPRPLDAGLDDIGNATAIGAALLAVHGAKPVFASSVGVRVSDRYGDRFHPVFSRGDPISFTSKDETFFVSDASCGVARLLVCDQEDPETQPGGRLLRVIPVPIQNDENWLCVRFTLDPHLILRVEAAGRKNLRADTFGRIRDWPSDSAVHIQQLNLGFRLPDECAQPVVHDFGV